MEWAARLLKNMLSPISFSVAVETEPDGNLAGCPHFLNQVVIACSPLSMENLSACLKQMEKEIGRRPEDKSRGLIPIDIDLLQWNDTILKPDDLKRDYIQSALQSYNSATGNI
jgi:2-amino-4-hydroxy-6-hydroxymethyldihydropteridine diphosphokinase